MLYKDPQAGYDYIGSRGPAGFCSDGSKGFADECASPFHWLYRRPVERGRPQGWLDADAPQEPQSSWMPQGLEWLPYFVGGILYVGIAGWGSFALAGAYGASTAVQWLAGVAGAALAYLIPTAISRVVYTQK